MAIKWVNMTPHEIKINERIFPREDEKNLMRVYSTKTNFPPIDGIPVATSKSAFLMVGEKEFPEWYQNHALKAHNELYLVSLICLQFIDTLSVDKRLFYAPNTGAAIRDGAGNIIAVRGIIRNEISDHENAIFKAQIAAKYEADGEK